VHTGILVIDRSLLHARTIAAMYETFGCEVACATDVEGAVDLLVRSNVDVVVMSQTFCRENGVPTRDAVRSVRPGLQIAVLDEPGDLGCSECSQADFCVRPTHFYTDLCSHMSLPQESSARSVS
jgi:DNA-binding NtrC family response regulator